MQAHQTRRTWVGARAKLPPQLPTAKTCIPMATTCTRPLHAGGQPRSCLGGQGRRARCPAKARERAAGGRRVGRRGRRRPLPQRAPAPAPARAGGRQVAQQSRSGPMARLPGSLLRALQLGHHVGQLGLALEAGRVAQEGGRLGERAQHRQLGGHLGRLAAADRAALQHALQARGLAGQVAVALRRGGAPSGSGRPGHAPTRRHRAGISRMAPRLRARGPDASTAARPPSGDATRPLTGAAPQQPCVAGLGSAARPPSRAPWRRSARTAWHARPPLGWSAPPPRP